MGDSLPNIVFTTDHGIELPRGKWELYDRWVESRCAGAPNSLR
jgi:hypothetical protein